MINNQRQNEARLAFEKAYKEIDKILEETEDENLPIEELEKKLNRASELSEICKKYMKILKSETNRQFKEALVEIDKIRKSGRLD